MKTLIDLDCSWKKCTGSARQVEIMFYLLNKFTDEHRGYADTRVRCCSGRSGHRWCTCLCQNMRVSEAAVV